MTLGRQQLREGAVVQRYFAEPYRFVAPYRGKFWCRVFAPVLPARLRRLGVYRFHFEGLQHLQASLERGAGVLLTSNHCRWADPAVIGMLSIRLGRYFYYLVSSHLLRQGWFSRWYLNRLGGYSVLREGTDRESLRAGARILAEADRPLVVFPEGTWFRQNDRLGPLQEGAFLTARHAVRQSDRPVVVHPLAVKYWYLADPRPALGRLLARQERRLCWPPQDDLDFLARVPQVAEAFMAVQEIRHFGQARHGPVDARVRLLTESHVAAIESRYLGRMSEGMVLERIRRLRQLLVRRLAEADPEGRRQAFAALDELLLCENLNAQSQEYLRERPSLERLAETVLRIEETITDAPEPPLAPQGAVVAVGPAIDVRDYEGGPRKGRRGPDPLLQDAAAGIQGLLDSLLRQGPPPAWGCPNVILAMPSPARERSGGTEDQTEILPAGFDGSA
jgi:1-acyl-sn-glycerol-3-phosphate acyltransferase